MRIKFLTVTKALICSALIEIAFYGSITDDSAQVHTNVVTHLYNTATNIFVRPRALAIIKPLASIRTKKSKDSNCKNSLNGYVDKSVWFRSTKVDA